MDGFDEFLPEQEDDEVAEVYRNWKIREDVGGKLYIRVLEGEIYCNSIDDAKKEIDKRIKKWGKQNAKRVQTRR